MEKQTFVGLMQRDDIESFLDLCENLKDDPNYLAYKARNKAARERSDNDLKKSEDTKE